MKPLSEVCMISYETQMEEILILILDNPSLHARWLNTLSYLENCGAKKIARFEHPTLVREEVLKHAAEEFRHAYYLKRQIPRVSKDSLTSYKEEHLLGGKASQHYLHALDIAVSRYLAPLTASKHELRELAYLLVTFAIEKRAFELYPLYHRLLKERRSPVTVTSIWLEEKEHLEEMERQLEKIPNSKAHKETAMHLESDFCKAWLNAVERDLPASNRSTFNLHAVAEES